MKHYKNRDQELKTMGRNGKSIEEHILNGTYRKDRHKEHLKLDALEEISIPEELNKAAADKWNEVIPSLLEAGLISNVDLPELTAAFIQYGTAQDCLNYVNENYKNHAEYLASLNLCKGTVDLLKRYSDCIEKYNKIMHRFGVTPYERTKIKIEPKEIDESDDLIKSLIGNG